jgi:DNA gyrase/topoisomerase IV subunit B
MITEPEWEKLSPYRQVRLRTEMYFGSRDPHSQAVLEYDDKGLKIVEITWVPAVFVTFRELIDNALDEVVTHGHGSKIDITYDPETMVFSVRDDGRGVPIEWSEQHQKHAATVLLTELMSGRNFKEDRGETRGLNGIGCKGVVYTSEWFQVEINRDKKTFEQRFREGDELIIEDPMIIPSSSKKTGTTIRFKPSTKVFPDTTLPVSFVAARIHEIAMCYPHLFVTFNGQRIQAKPSFGDHNPIVFEIDEAGFKGRFWLVPNFLEEGEFSHSLVNAIPVFGGGVHIDSFRKGFYSGLLAAMEKESKRRDLVPNKADVSEGLLLYCILEMTSPSFDSQAKTRLINENVGAIVRKTLDSTEFFKRIIKQYPEWLEEIYQRCDERTSAKDSNTAKKLAKRNLRTKIEDLEDACGYDRLKCSIFLAEGNSAVSGLIDACDKEIHGALPLRGKVLNVFGETNKDILANEALSKIMNSVGLMLGERVNRRNLRYGKVYITCDADPDGANISALLVNFFYTCWPELFDPERSPFIFIFNTPLIIAAKGKQRKYWYSDTYDEFDADKTKGWEITRAKGLAALKKEDWKYILANPQAVPIIDDGDLKETLGLLFDHDRTDDRKRFIGI